MGDAYRVSRSGYSCQPRNQLTSSEASNIYPKQITKKKENEEEEAGLEGEASRAQWEIPTSAVFWYM